MRNLAACRTYGEFGLSWLFTRSQLAAKTLPREAARFIAGQDSVSEPGTPEPRFFADHTLVRLTPLAVLPVPEVGLYRAKNPNALSDRLADEGLASAPAPNAVLV